MLEALREEQIVNKVGGRFKLSTQDKMQVVLQEIIQDKIYLDATQQVRLVGEFQGTGESMELDLGDL